MKPLPWRGAAAAALLVLFAACVGDEHPRIRACKGVADVGPDLAHGPLAILPSQVPGAEIDSATWFTQAHTFDLGAEAQLVLTARIVVSQPMSDGDLALVYRASGDVRPMVDSMLYQPIYGATDAEQAAWGTDDRLAGRRRSAGERFRAEHVEDVQVGMSTTRWLPFAGCPASVQLVRRAVRPAPVDSPHVWAGLHPPAESGSAAR